MDRAKVESEIAGLQEKLSQLKEEMILTDGAIQAFKWVLAEMEKVVVEATEVAE